MTATDMANSTYIKVDDTFDDAEAAYREVMGRTEAKSEPVKTPAVEEVHEEPEVAASGKGSKRQEKPADESPEATGDDERHANGRFKSKADRSPPSGQTAGAEGDAQPAAPATPTAGLPPSSFSVKSKAAWNALPQEVRDDIVKRESEVANGLAALRDFKDLKPWAEHASRNGTTIAQALKNYTGIENLLRKDVAAGLALIAQNAGLDQSKAAQVFATLAQKFGHGQQPDADDPVAQAINPLLKPLLDKIGGLESQLKSRETAESQARMASLDTALKTLEADAAYPFVSNLIEDMTFLLESGRIQKSGNDLQDLKAAYDTAARLNPQVHEALIEQRLATERETQRRAEQEAAARAKAASRSVSGSKIPGTVTTQAPGNGDRVDDMEDDVRAAYRAIHSR